jgi:superfamily II DNA or RNA helicase
MVEEYSKHAAGLPALGFAATREKAAQYAAHFTASGISADTLFGSDTDLKRQGTLARLRKGALRVLWTCNVLGEGWDYPGLRCVMLARPTLSDALYLQQVARCMRPGDPPVVLDLWGAWSVFDPPWADFRVGLRQEGAQRDTSASAALGRGGVDAAV